MRSARLVACLLAAVLAPASGVLATSAHAAPTTTQSATADDGGLHPLVWVNPKLFSPSGDGRLETTVVSYSLDQPQTVYLRIVSSAGTLVRSAKLGTNKPAGTYRWTWDGRDNAGARVANGNYTVQLHTNRVTPAGTIRGRTTALVGVDRTRPVLTGVPTSSTTIYPFADGYRDQATLAIATSEWLSSLEVRIANNAGTRVRTLRLADQRAGTRSLTWDGRSDSSALLPAGTYTYQFVAMDRALNMGVSERKTIVLSHKRTVGKVVVQVVSPAASLETELAGACSELVTPARADWAGSVGYYSNYQCDDAATSDAGARHAFTIPATPGAVRWGALRVGAFGGAAGVEADEAFLRYYNAAGTRLDTTYFGGVLGPTEAQRYLGPITAGEVLDGRTIRWYAGTRNGSWYDIKHFTVQWRYDVLQ